MSLFDDIKEVIGSVVEYIPVFGTMYSLTQASVAYREHDSLNLWLSLADYFESGIRDVVLLSGVQEPPTIAIVHAMLESATEKIIEVVHRGESKEPSSSSEVKRETYIFSPIEGNKIDKKIFTDNVKGVHYFHGAIFIGKLKLRKRSKYTNYNEGEEIRLEIPHGLYNGAQVTFSWKWTEDAHGKKNRPEITYGIIQLETPTKFKLWKREGFDDVKAWDGYDFDCEVKSTDKIDAKAKDMAGDDETTIIFKRDPRTYIS